MAPARLFHYCSERAATDILAEEPPYFLVGTGSSYGWGMYATDIEPLDATTILFEARRFDGSVWTAILP